jgi:3-oxoadipate enol-lactonase
MLHATRAEGWHGLAAAMATADLYQTTATLTLPTLVLAGGEDRKVPPDMQRETADLIAGAEFRLLPGGSHLSMLTDPARFGQALGGFLTRIGHG